MQELLKEVQNLRDEHGKRGTMLLIASDGLLFPCDVLAFTVLERSLNLIKGFDLLLTNRCYTTGMGLLRMQMDNVLRFNGVINVKDPNDVALQMYHGTPLRKIKDDDGQNMMDARLMELLAVGNPWVEQVYELSSGYIHLSDQHFHHFLNRSPKGPDGVRDLFIGDEDEFVPAEDKAQLIKAFAVLTRAILKLVDKWIAERHKYGSVEDLKEKYNQPV